MKVITRHFIDVGARRVHYRRCGKGPPLLMVHQSPRSSAEYESLMQVWGEYFTCIAPDSPGFGQSDPLPGEPSVDDFADANIALLDALGLQRVHAYGFHSGAIILVTAIKRAPQRFVAVALVGYAIWTAEEQRLFSENYLPPFVPQPYGEHLTWVWNRILEQGWFFPWFDVRDETRMRRPHADPLAVHASVMDMLDAGDAYRAGYSAVMRAPRHIPAPGAETPPVLLTAYDSDPLQAHIDRLGVMPACWEARKVATPIEQQEATLAFLNSHPAAGVGALPEAEDEGFANLPCEGFAGQIHWIGRHTASRMQIHAPGGEARVGPSLAVDLPGHGLSDDWAGSAPTGFEAWRVFVETAKTHFGVKHAEGIGWSAALCNREAPHLPHDLAKRLIPDLTPDRFGGHLTRAWGIARAQRLFEPWFIADAAHVTKLGPTTLDLNLIARDARALLRGRSARALLSALSEGDK